MGRKKYTTNFTALFLFAALAGALVVALFRLTPELSTYEDLSVVASVTVGQQTVQIPSWQLFRTGNMWQLVSSAHTLPLDYVPDLVTTTVAHTNGATQVAKPIEGSLVSLTQAAANNGVSLMLSSAYRSSADQQSIYASLLTAKGSQYVHDYVATPGTSEHQTGLAVDIASTSTACTVRADACSLDAAAIAWLRAHAVEYGFIERYPAGKQSLTGIAGEHWHYRYVGVPLARALKNANMTLDEFVQQTAPGYSRKGLFLLAGSK